MGTDTGCTVPSVLLFFDRQRYLFNAGEGFQRFCVEHRVRLSKVSGVLATRTTTEATGGLPGMGMVAAAAGVCVWVGGGGSCRDWEAETPSSQQRSLTASLAQ